MSAFTLRPDQVEDLAALIRNPKHGLWSEPGTGKTPVACLYTWWNHQRNGGTAVWVQPLAIIKKNREELLRFTKFAPEDVVIVAGTPTQRAVLYAKKAPVYLMGADTFGKEWDRLPPISLLIGDEWHMMYSTNGSKRTQALYAALRTVPRVCPMTGTLIRGRLDSAFSAINVIEPRYYSSHGAFMHYHALLDEWGKPFKWLNEGKITELLNRHGQRRLFKDVYGDVPVVFETHYVTMSGAQEKAYKEFEEKAILELDNAFLDGSLPGVNLIRARQILSSPELFGIAKGEQTARDALLEIQIADHRQSGAPWMIGSASKPEQKRVLEMLTKAGIKTGLMNGDTSPANRGKMDEDFRSGALQCLIVSPLVGAIGFNWGHCDHVTFLHLDYYADSFEQFWKRTTRGVRTRPVLIDIIVYDDTVEEAVLGVLVKKMKLSNSVDPAKQVVNLHGRKKKFETVEALAA